MSSQAAMILLTLIFEIIIRHIENKTKNHTHSKEMIQKLFKELMILGFVSFGVLLTIELSSGYATSSPIFISFELAHLWIFFIAVIFIVNAIIGMIRVKNIKEHWDFTACIPIQELLERYRKTDHKELKWPYIFYLLKGRGSLREEMSFHIIKKMFIRLHLLPSMYYIYIIK